MWIQLQNYCSTITYIVNKLNVKKKYVKLVYDSIQYHYFCFSISICYDVPTAKNIGKKQQSKHFCKISVLIQTRQGFQFYHTISWTLHQDLPSLLNRLCSILLWDFTTQLVGDRPKISLPLFHNSGCILFWDFTLQHCISHQINYE